MLDSARATGADVTFLGLAKPGSAWAEPSEVVLGAMKRAQKCLSMALVYHDRRTTIARRERRMSMFFLLPPAAATLRAARGGRLPDRAVHRDRTPVCARYDAPREIRITSRRRHQSDARPPQLHRQSGRLARGVGSGPDGRHDAGEGSNTFPRRRARVPRSRLGARRRRLRAPRRGQAVRAPGAYERGRCVAAQRGRAPRDARRTRRGPRLCNRRGRARLGTNPLSDADTRHGAQPDRRRAPLGDGHIGIGPSPIFGSRTTSRLHLDGLVVRPSSPSTASRS